MKSMSLKLLIVSVLVILSVPAAVFADDEYSGILPLYTGSDIRYNDNMGYEKFSFIIGESELYTGEGILTRVFCRAPEGRSPYEVVKNYEEALENSGGTVLFHTRNPKEINIDGKKFSDIFKMNRRDRGLSTYHYTHTDFPNEVTEYLAGKIVGADKDIYILVAAGPGAWAASQHNRTFFELITFEVQAMETGLVTAAEIGTGLTVNGKIALYNIFFDSGRSDVKSESDEALKQIAEFLKSDKSLKVLIVGHTDNTGDFDMNIKLSKDRADAVTAKLISEFGVDTGQLKPYGAGPVSPVTSNSTEAGRTRNRRVEVVER